MSIIYHYPYVIYHFARLIYTYLLLVWNCFEACIPFTWLIYVSKFHVYPCPSDIFIKKKQYTPPNTGNNTGWETPPQKKKKQRKKLPGQALFVVEQSLRGGLRVTYNVSFFNFGGGFGKKKEGKVETGNLACLFNQFLVSTIKALIKSSKCLCFFSQKQSLALFEGRI